MLEHRVGVGMVLHHEPTGVLVWPEAVGFADAVAGAATPGHELLFHYVATTRLRTLASDPHELAAAVAKARASATTTHEPAVFDKGELAKLERLATRGGTAGSRSPQHNANGTLGCLALRPLQATASNALAPESSDESSDALVADARASYPLGAKCVEFAAPVEQIAEVTSPEVEDGAEGALHRPAAAGPFTRRLVAKGVAVTRWDPQRAAWLAPRQQAVEEEEEEEGEATPDECQEARGPEFDSVISSSPHHTQCHLRAQRRFRGLREG